LQRFQMGRGLVIIAFYISGIESNVQHIHILGICGTFMGSLAQLAIDQGYRVTGCDANVFPPMSTQLEQAGIQLIQGFDAAQLELNPDLFIIGNAISRGNPLLEAILNQGLPYTSGPQWLSDHILQGKWVLAIAGTHGKSTTSSMLAWILEYAQMAPGFLIGGVPANFERSARLGKTPFFVIEADEYDTAFFDKRSKFVHYRPRTLAINNLEFDHADIFDNLAAIEKQFHHLVRTVPSNGLVIYPEAVPAIERVLAHGCWAPTVSMGGRQQQSLWTSELHEADGSHFSIYCGSEKQCEIQWSLIGDHNVSNGLTALLAARHVGVTPKVAAEALATFKGIKRRLEVLANIDSVVVYDDFAHHPTAIATTLAGLRQKVGSESIIAVIEPRSNTMRMGVHQTALAKACAAADAAFWYSPDSLHWDVNQVIIAGHNSQAFVSLDDLVIAVCNETKKIATAHIVVMSNGGFGGVHQKIIQQLKLQSS